MFNNISQLMGVSPELRAFLGTLFGGLPVIRGQWFVVDPYKLTVSDGGIGGSFSTLHDAYNACTSGEGDGIVILSGGTGTSSQTTSYLSSALTWSKHGITVVGIAAPTFYGNRARIANKIITTGSISTIAFPTATTITDSASGFLTAGFKIGDILRIDTTQNTNDSTGNIITAVTAGTITCGASTFTIQTAGTAGATVITSYCSTLINVSGSNNSFINLNLYNADTDALALTALTVSGTRNYFQNVSAGVGVADANTTITHSLWLSAAEENTFVGCTFGLDTVDRGNVATYDIYLSGAVARNRFYNCETIRWSSLGTSCLAVYANTTTGGRPTLFKNCIFTSWNTAGGNANQAYMFGSTGACDFVWFVDCTYPGYAALSNDSVAWISGEVNTQASGLMYT